MSKLMELVEEYGFECLHSGDDEQRLHAQIRAAVADLERDAADGVRFVAFMSAFGAQDNRFLTAVHDALPADGESLDYIRAAIDAAMEAANVPEH